MCSALPVSIELPAGSSLLEALGRWAEQNGYSSAVLDFQALSLAPFDYVMPDRAIDDRHAAWYSDTRSSAGAVLREAVAIFGWREGNWFAHVHAYWDEAGTWHLGHLLPHTLTVESFSRITGFGLKGARFEAEPDPETEFTLFRIKEDRESASEFEPNALIATLAPFEDLHDGIATLSKKLGPGPFEAFGLGSLAGAGFRDAPAMTGLISEILLRRPSGGSENGLSVPVRCVDLDGNLHAGVILPGAAPTLITCELLLRRSPAGL